MQTTQAYMYSQIPAQRAVPQQQMLLGAGMPPFPPRGPPLQQYHGNAQLQTPLTQSSALPPTPQMLLSSQQPSSLPPTAHMFPRGIGPDSIMPGQVQHQPQQQLQQLMQQQQQQPTASGQFENTSQTRYPSTAESSASYRIPPMNPQPAQQSSHRVPQAAPGFVRSIDSFRVLTECPLIVMLLFQLYAKYIKQSVPLLVPGMMDFLSQIPPTNATRVQRERYKEFIAAQVPDPSAPISFHHCDFLTYPYCLQVKTLSFLTYLLRGFTELMGAYENAITKNVLSLLQMCPGEAVATRKEVFRIYSSLCQLFYY